jgi:hypothetical protein
MTTTTMRWMLGALVPVLCTVACGQAVGTAEGDGGAAVTTADAGRSEAGAGGGGSTIDAGRGVLDDPNFPPYEEALQRGPEHWVSGSGAVNLREGATGTMTPVPSFSITRSPITNREFAQCVRDGVCKLELVNDPNCRDTTVFRGPNREVLDHLAWIFRNTTLKKSLWDAPITCLKYEQAEKYCAWIGAKLPTVPQFVLVARGPYGEPIRRYPWGNTPPTCAESANPTNWNSSSNLVVNCCGKHCDDPSLYAVGTHPAGASPLGMQDVLMTPIEFLRRGSEPNVAADVGCFAFSMSRNAYSSDIASVADMHRIADAGCASTFLSDQPGAASFRCVR